MYLTIEQKPVVHKGEIQEKRGGGWEEGEQEGNGQ